MKQHRRIIGIITLIGSILFSLALTACTGAATTATGQAGDGSPQASQPGEQRTMPLETQLALSAFKLEETDYAIDAKQAEKLLPLWKTARSLSQSETVAQEEVQAVFKQIENTLTPEQMAAIEDMELSFQDMGDIAEKYGIELGGGRFGDLSPEMQATMQAARESGQGSPGGFGGQGFPGGGPGGGMGDASGGFSPEAAQTQMAAGSGPRGATLGLNSALLDAIIEFLEAKLQ
ncbi:MAG: hypothetical protein JXA78_19875 [Anaerolineales bacterium]|nr:hypothetical protein [Anaerolineales bacterium]